MPSLSRRFAATPPAQPTDRKHEQRPSFRTASVFFPCCRGSPLRRLWDPRLTFTGTSIMGINPTTRERPCTSTV